MTFQIGDKVTFTDAHKRLVHNEPRKRKERAPTWVDQVCTVVDVQAEGWLITVETDGWDGRKGVNKQCLNPPIET
jgi:hypothetical protein